MERINLCDNWQFTQEFTEEFLHGMGEYEIVRIPHTCKELPLHYAEPNQYEMVCGYAKTIFVPKGWKGKRVLLHFDGAAHIATIFINGKEAATHKCGYTHFMLEITDFLFYEEDNRIAVLLDTRESSNIPPFGHVVDYMTYGGIYREVYMEVKEQSFISDVFVKTPQNTCAQVSISIENPKPVATVQLKIYDNLRKVIYNGIISKEQIAEQIRDYTCKVSDALPWSVDSPNLYNFEVSLKDDLENLLDTREVKFGFRQAIFKSDGFYLNGKKLKIRGLNRHQSYPYVGYAMPKSMQYLDADILKNELHVNSVRTSHYPQSQHFINRCDELGILVFTEIPGWQHIGDGSWKEIAYENVKEMVLQYRNHPSVILWGVRINESKDDDEFYKKTNEITHDLDTTRQTSGVRYLWRSHLLEDVYSFNDFSHTGKNSGLLPRKLISRDTKKGYLISEFNGHMFPTKSFDTSSHRLEQALRYINVLDTVYKNEDISGCFGWCMFDYQTHGDFGSGDRICYHGVMDMFRNPKLAASIYASFQEDDPVLEIGSDMHIGDYPAGNMGDNYIFTNADSVRFYKGKELIKEFKAQSKKWRNLPHPPIFINDTIGDQLEKKEGYSHKKAENIKECLMAVQRYGTKLPVSYIFKIVWRMLRYGVSLSTANRLYYAYIENWGAHSISYRFEAVKGGKVVRKVIKESCAELHLEVKVSHKDLCEEDTYDVAAVRIRIVDKNGNVAHYCNIPVSFQVSGELKLIGSTTVCAEGGMCGTYVKTTGRSGMGTLTISTEQTESENVIFSTSIK